MKRMNNEHTLGVLLASIIFHNILHIIWIFLIFHIIPHTLHYPLYSILSLIFHIIPHILQGHPERVEKVNKLWKSQFSKKISVLSCSWKKNSDKLLPHIIQISQKCFEASLKGCASNVDWVKIRFKEPKKPELAGASGPSMHPESLYFVWEPIFHPNHGQIPYWPKFGSLGGSNTSFGCFEALFQLTEPASIGGATFEGSLKTFLRDLDEVGE